MNINLRKARIGDINVLADFNQRLAIYHKKICEYSDVNTDKRSATKARIKTTLNSRNARIIVAEYNDQVVGYIWGRFAKPTQPVVRPRIVGFVQECFVEKPSRRKGVGRLLWHGLENWFRIKKVQHVELLVYKTNIPAIEVWSAFGFKEYAKTLKLDL